jgi:diguanylate cyclase (GGDEF)-like protein/PAS domain S-box-containing protein
MTAIAHRAANQTNNHANGECVLLIDAESDEAARIFVELRSATDEQLHVEWVTELSAGIERLRTGAVAAIVLDLTLLESQGAETFDKLFHASPGVPILILCVAGAEEMARQAVQRGAQDYLVRNEATGYRLSRALRSMMDRRTATAVSLECDLAHATLDGIGEAVLRTGVNGQITYVNRVAERMTGWLRTEALGRPVMEVLRIIDGAGGAPMGNVVESALQQGQIPTIVSNSLNCVLVRRDGLEFGIETTVTPLRDRHGVLTGAVVGFHDVSLARATSHEMSHLAQHDFLTGLPNRMLFNDRLAQAISLAERQSKQLAVLFVDLDHFKKINDSLGHVVGDKLLQSVAGRLVACIRRTDTVSRMGGDEFVILLSQVEHEEDAAFSARKILRVLATPHIIDNKSLDINVSIGVSTYPGDGRDAEDLMNKADKAMYEAKQHGRNTYRFFRHDMQARLSERLSLEGDLRYALGRNEFLLHYQPKFNLQTGKNTGLEAFIRWMHPTRGMVSPGEFVPIAEECGLMLSIGRWVLLQACRQVREWRDLGLGVVPLAVNVSAAEFGAKDFLSGVRAVLIATGMEPPNLELELTESVLMEDAESTVVTLRALKAMGVGLAIDDFGTGYSSFTYLRRFPSDALKLHQSFVHDITENPGDATIVSAMINIGKSLKQRVIAEGVETQAQLDFLRRHGCDEGQGYYFSRPVAADQVPQMLNADLRVGMVGSVG